MEINNNSEVRQALLTKILNQSSETASTVSQENSDTNVSADATLNTNDKVNVGLSKYISSELSASDILSEREQKLAKLKELYDKGEYKGAEAKELAKSFVEDINDEIALARNKVFFGDDEI